MNIFEKLLAIQQELKAPKGQYNSFGKYNYRSCEDILEAVKPICAKYNAVLTVSDELVYMGNRYYIKATATIVDAENPDMKIIDIEGEVKNRIQESITNTAYAREEETKKGMDGSQITGTASSYARKYALNGLFCIDDTKDADTDEFKKQEQKAKEMGIKEIKKLAEKYAKMKKGKSDELLNYYINKYNVDELADLTQAQVEEIMQTLTTLIRRVEQ